MIKLKNLKSDFQFKRLLSQKKIHTDYFSVYFGKNLTKENNNKLNISFIMKKKVGSSVVRNKIKRRLRAAIQNKLKSLKKFEQVQNIEETNKSERLNAVLKYIFSSNSNIDTHYSYYGRTKLKVLYLNFLPYFL